MTDKRAQAREMAGDLLTGSHAEGSAGRAQRRSSDRRHSYVTWILRSMPSSLWPGTVHHSSYVPGCSVTVS